MNTQQAIRKCHKKAWEEIKNLQTANNMLEVEQLIEDAKGKTFGFWNNGIEMVRMRRLGLMRELEHAMRIRRSNWNNHVGLIHNYLAEMIPNKFHNSLMYRKFMGHIN